MQRHVRRMARAKRYAKMREVASRYNIIQFGMALFHEKRMFI